MILIYSNGLHFVKDEMYFVTAVVDFTEWFLKH
jgi:hypothetical protein